MRRIAALVALLAVLAVAAACTPGAGLLDPQPSRSELPGQSPAFSTRTPRPPDRPSRTARQLPTFYPITPTGGRTSAPAPTAAADPDRSGLVPAVWADGIPERAVPATVLGITDGDTISVDVGGQRESVRLLLIDTPETRHPSLPVQCYGPEATAFVRSALPIGTEVYLEPDVEDRDRYGRALRYVWLEVEGEPHLLNEAVVRNGYAVRSIYPPNVRYVDEIGAAQTAAREEGLGLWGACGDYGAQAAD